MAPSGLCLEICSRLKQEGLHPLVVRSGDAATVAVSAQPPLAVLVDLSVLSDGPKAVSTLVARTPVVLTGSGEELEAVLASQQDPAVPFSILPKPLDATAAAFLLRAAVRRRPPFAPSRPNTAAMQAVKALVLALEAKDIYTLNHSRMVAHLAGLTARAMNLGDEQVQRVRLAGLLHDLGMIAVRQEILNKPGPLTMTEREHVNVHPIVSERLLRPIPALADLLPVVRHHHERFDGSGYPDHLAGARIPLWSRILAVADVYDALISIRAHRPPCSLEAASEHIQREAGTLFDPRVATTFAGVANRCVSHPAKVLVVEECPKEAGFFRDAVAEDGHDVVIVGDASDALAAVRETDFDLVILDPVAPGSRGLHVARRVHQQRPNTPIILCTAVTGLQDDMSLWELDIAAFVPKPADPSLLRQEVRRALTARHSPVELCLSV